MAKEKAAPREKKTKPIFFRPTPELRARFLDYVAKRDTSQQEILMEALKDYLDRVAATSTKKRGA